VKTLILGLGNPILTDDGVGVLVAESVRSKLPENSGIDVSEASVGGLTLMESMLGYDRVILIDAIHGRAHKPGDIERLTLADLKTLIQTQHTASPHDVNLVTAFEIGQKMGVHLPEKVIIFAIGVENVSDFGDQPTPSVAAAIPIAIEAILREVNLENEEALWSHPN
jgi:hydrogenase maturation protease